MPIDRDTFDQASEDELAELSATDHVLGFLAVNDDMAFKAVEIASQTELGDGAVNTSLARLEARDLVVHKGPYWAITMDESKLEGYEGFDRAKSWFTDQFRKDDATDLDGLAPDEPHANPWDEDD